MALRNLTRTFCQLAKRTNINQRLFSSIQGQQQPFYRKLNLIQPYIPIRTYVSREANVNAYGDLNTFLQKEIQLEKTAQKHPDQIPSIAGFQAESNGPEVTLTRQTGNEKVVVKFNVTNTVNANESDDQPDLNPSGQDQQGNESSPQLKSRPTFTVDINRGGQTLSFLCSYLPNDYPAEIPEQARETDNQEDHFEDFQIDEFTIHDGEWNDKVYSSDCSVIDGELYDKLLNLLEEHGIGEGLFEYIFFQSVFFFLSFKNSPINLLIMQQRMNIVNTLVY